MLTQHESCEVNKQTGNLVVSCKDSSLSQDYNLLGFEIPNSANCSNIVVPKDAQGRLLLVLVNASRLYVSIQIVLPKATLPSFDYELQRTD